MISAIAAVGNQWQIGLDGKLPWPRHDEDMKWFRRYTQGKALVAGYNTYKECKEVLDGSLGRTVMLLDEDPMRWDWHLEQKFIDRGTIIIGGAECYKQTASVVDQLYLSRIDYDGPADTYFPIDAFSPEQIQNAIWRGK